MFAVIKTGSKQYKVQKDSIIITETIPGDAGTDTEGKKVINKI